MTTTGAPSDGRGGHRPARPAGAPGRPQPRWPRWSWWPRGSWWPRWARGGEPALVYAGLVLVVALVLDQLPPAAHRAAVLAASTDLENLRHDPAAVLLLSAFVVQTRAEVLLLVPLVVVMTLCGRWTGRLSTLVAALFGHVGATLVVATFLAAGVRRGEVPPSVTTAPDVGVSYALAGTAGLLAAGLPRRWRWAWALAGLAALSLVLAVDPGPTGAGHLLAFATGLGLAVVAVGSRAHERS